MSRIAVGLLQLPADPGDNSDAMIAEIDAAVARFPWVDLFVAPELCACGTNPDTAEPMPGPREARFQAVARRHGIWLVPGSFFEQEGDAVYNTMPVISPDGEVVARYRKLFPWLPYETGTTPGREFVVFDIPGVGRFGLSNCYDIWFPETLRTLTCLGAEVILHPSLTSTIDRKPEHHIIQASAAMFECYVVDVNLGPSLGCGQSLVAGPGGDLIYAAGRGREIVPLVLDLDAVRDVRRNGWHGLGQPLKSFRDSRLAFPPYREGYVSRALAALGPLEMPQRRLASMTEPDRDG